MDSRAFAAPKRLRPRRRVKSAAVRFSFKALDDVTRRVVDARVKHAHDVFVLNSINCRRART